jgi:hypothetical protein
VPTAVKARDADSALVVNLMIAAGGVIILAAAVVLAVRMKARKME